MKRKKLEFLICLFLGGLLLAAVRDYAYYQIVRPKDFDLIRTIVCDVLLILGVEIIVVFGTRNKE